MNTIHVERALVAAAVRHVEHDDGVPVASTVLVVLFHGLPMLYWHWEPLQQLLKGDVGRITYLWNVSNCMELKITLLTCAYVRKYLAAEKRNLVPAAALWRCVVRWDLTGPP